MEGARDFGAGKTTEKVEVTPRREGERGSEHSGEVLCMRSHISQGLKPALLFSRRNLPPS